MGRNAQQFPVVHSPERREQPEHHGANNHIHGHGHADIGPDAG